MASTPVWVAAGSAASVSVAQTIAIAFAGGVLARTRLSGGRTSVKDITTCVRMRTIIRCLISGVSLSTLFGGTGRLVLWPLSHDLATHWYSHAGESAAALASADVLRRDSADRGGDRRRDVYSAEGTRTARPGRDMLLRVWKCSGVATQHLAGSCCQRGLDQRQRGQWGAVADHVCVCVHSDGCPGAHPAWSAKGITQLCEQLNQILLCIRDRFSLVR
jgi:hypothetical protein